MITLHRLTTHTFLPWHSPRYLLDFGEVSTYLGYSALTDFFPRYEMRPNPQCSVGHCVAAQAAYQVTNYLTANVLVGPNRCCLGTGEHPFVHESHINYFAVASKPGTIATEPGGCKAEGRGAHCTWRDIWLVCLTLRCPLCLFIDQVHLTVQIIRSRTIVPGIIVESESTPEEDTTAVAPGLRREHEGAVAPIVTGDDGQFVSASEQTVEEMMAQLKGL